MGILCLVVVLVACNAGGKKAETTAPSVELDPTSYAFGMYMATQVKGSGMTFDYDSIARGFKEYYEDQTTQFSVDEAMMLIQTAYMAAYDALSNQERQNGITFLAENAKKAGIVTTASGLQYEVITEGSGAKPVASDTVRVHYEGRLLDGSVFDSSYERGEPIEFPLYGVIPGWTEGLQLMSEGSTYNLYIPSELAYGEDGASVIPPNSTLIFKVELIAIVQEE
jgi:FKBP-type peptidyl-prolyl cis-trans isomerase FkpA